MPTKLLVDVQRNRKSPTEIVETKFASHHEINKEEMMKKLLLERQLRELQRLNRKRTVSSKRVAGLNAAGEGEMMKKEVVLRLRLANDTMLLIKEKKDISKLFKRKPEISTAKAGYRYKKTKLGRSYDYAQKGRNIFGDVLQDSRCSSIHTNLELSPPDHSIDPRTRTQMGFYTNPKFSFNSQRLRTSYQKCKCVFGFPSLVSRNECK